MCLQVKAAHLPSGWKKKGQLLSGWKLKEYYHVNVFCFNLYIVYLNALISVTITLWASVHLLSSLTRVTSLKSFRNLRHCLYLQAGPIFQGDLRQGCIFYMVKCIYNSIYTYLYKHVKFECLD